VTCLLKTWIIEAEKTAIAGHWLRKHVSAATVEEFLEKKHTTREELLEVFLCGPHQRYILGTETIREPGLPGWGNLR
jgi:hypothetical protein